MIEALQEVLVESVQARHLPGASVALWHDGVLIEAAAGVLNAQTGVEVTADSLFEIGSITKPYTATVVMQLVDEGVVDLDAPVRRYLPEFRVADAAATEAITVRHLLTHTSGFDGGDHFFDGGSGDDTLQRAVASLARLGQLTAPGRLWSYTNAGYYVLGRLVELVTGDVFDEAMRTRLLAPAGLDHSVTLSKDLVRYRVAAGHRAGVGGTPELRSDGLPRTAGPIGGVRASAADVVGFARLHLDGGRGLLSREAVALMQRSHVAIPGTPSETFGLGWLVRDLDSTTSIGHNGGTLGQLAYLSIVPEHDFAIALLTNGPTAQSVWNDVAGHVTTELGLPSLKPRIPQPPREPVEIDLAKYEGRYERHGVQQTVAVEGEYLVMRTEHAGMAIDLPPPPPLALFAVDAELFVTLGKDYRPNRACQFLDFDSDGGPDLLFVARLARRVSG